MLDLVGFAADLADECGWEEDLSAQYWTNSRRFRTATVNTVRSLDILLCLFR